MHEPWRPEAPHCPNEYCKCSDTVAGSCIGRTPTGVEMWTYVCRGCRMGFTCRVARDKPGKHIACQVYDARVKWVRELLAREGFVCLFVQKQWIVEPA